MKCFYHPQTDAVAQCTHCQKGVCHDCTFEDVGGWCNLCYECFKDGANVDFAKARRRITGLWVFTGAVTIIGGIAAISSDGAVGILLIPLIFAAAWCFYWGWLPFWGWVRGRGFSVAYASSGGGDPAGTIMRLFVIALLIEVVIFVIMGIGLFTGIQKFRRDRRTIALMNRGWLNLFPGKYVPGMGYMPEVQEQGRN